MAAARSAHGVRDSWSRAPALLWALSVVLLAIDVTAVLVDDGPWLGPVPGTFVWLVALAVPLGFVHARVPNGYISLGGIVTSAAALSANPRAALLVSLVPSVLSNVAVSRATLATRACLVLGAGAWTIVPSWAAGSLRQAGLPEAAVETAALALYTATNWVITATVGGALLQINPVGVIRDNLNRHWVAAFIYICMSAALVHNLLDRTLRGYLLGFLAVMLSLALADAVAGRQLNRALLSQLKDADRYLGYSRIVEGTVHNVRNFLTAALGNIQEARDAENERQRTQRLNSAAAALEDAAHRLAVLGSGSSPHLEWSVAPVNLGQLANNVGVLLRDRAAGKRVKLEVRRVDDCAVYCDPTLIREVMANLTLNAIEAAPVGGSVMVRVGWRLQHAFVSVSDDGGGVPEKYRDRLFEPHFTTKTEGSGIGLFMSYGIAREHHGALLYEGDSEGATFTLLLKRDGREG